ncbi:MAG: hypothetical protein ACK6DY_24420, partial [Acidobacteriota bacterium]
MAAGGWAAEGVGGGGGSGVGGVEEGVDGVTGAGGRGARGFNEGPVLPPVGAFGDPAAEEVDFGGGEG